MQDPTYKHEYLDTVQSWVTITEGENGDESDKHLEARDRRYSCLKIDWLVFIVERNSSQFGSNQVFQMGKWLL